MPNTRERLIDERLDLTDVICYAMRDWDDYIDECRETETPPIDSFEDFIADGILSAGYRKQKWIPVSERLPEVNVPVLVYDGKNVDGFTFYDLSYVSKYGVTHWQPLPEPPKGE